MLLEVVNCKSYLYSPLVRHISIRWHTFSFFRSCRIRISLKAVMGNCNKPKTCLKYIWICSLSDCQTRSKLHLSCKLKRSQRNTQNNGAISSLIFVKEKLKGGGIKVGGVIHLLAWFRGKPAWYQWCKTTNITRLTPSFSFSINTFFKATSRFVFRHRALNTSLKKICYIISIKLFGREILTKYFWEETLHQWNMHL